MSGIAIIYSDVNHTREQTHECAMCHKQTDELILLPMEGIDPKSPPTEQAKPIARDTWLCTTCTIIAELRVLRSTISMLVGFMGKLFTMPVTDSTKGTPGGMFS